MDNNLPSLFRLARNVSKLSPHRKYKIGAVLVINGKPISVGHNQSKTHPQALYTGLHAEIQALKASGKSKLKGSIVFVYRNRKDGSLAIARPCKNCMKELKEFGVKRIFYTCDEYPFFESEDIK